MTDLCQRSEALYDVCVACQAYLSYGANSLFYELYSEALSKFRAGIDHPLLKTDAALLNAALLLCTIGVCHSLTNDTKQFTAKDFLTVADHP